MATGPVGRASGRYVFCWGGVWGPDEEGRDDSEYDGEGVDSENDDSGVGFGE